MQLGNGLKVLPVSDPAFKAYGQIPEGYDFTEMLNVLRESTPKPEDGTIYYPGVDALEKAAVFFELKNRYYGGMPIQAGCCNGTNHLLNCLEYHRDSEVDIAADDVILLLARQDEIQDGKLDTSKVKAFYLPAGQAVELYATTLHYAPCDGKPGEGFRVVIVLPLGTNTGKPAYMPNCAEDRLMTARNKWLLAHPDSSEAKNGAVIGLSGENISTSEVSE